MINITINSIDRTDKVEFGSIEIQNILTRKRDRCSFDIISHTGQIYKPKLGEEIVITDDGTKIFGGLLVSSRTKPSAFDTVINEYLCHDYTRMLDRKLVPDTFKNESINDIIASLKDDYFPHDITINNVDAPPIIKYVAFNYKPLASVLTELADAVNYDWWIDYDKDLHFQSKLTSTAPIDIKDDDGSYSYDSLIIRRDNSQLRNTIIVRGGKYLAAQLTWEQVADGKTNTFPTRYQFTDFEASLTGQALNIGINAINDPNDFDALHDFNQKILIFKEADKPSLGNFLKMSGKPNLPVIVKYTDPISIAATRSAELGSGDYEYLIEDKSINSKEGARQRAEAEVLAYATTLSEGEFITETSGLKAGQRIYINSVSRGIAEYFVINKVVIRQRTANKFAYHISLITTRTFDLIDVLQRLLLESTKKITISQDETVDLVEAFPAEEITLEDVVTTSKVHNPITEGITMGESFSANIDYPVEFVVGPYTPTGSKRVFILDGSPLG